MLDTGYNMPDAKIMIGIAQLSFSVVVKMGECIFCSRKVRKTPSALILKNTNKITPLIKKDILRHI